MARNTAFEQVKVVADRHGKSEQFFEPLLRCGEFDRDAAGFEPYTGGEVLKFLIYNDCGSFDQQLGLSDPLLPQILDQAGHFAAALDLVEALLAFGDALQPGNQGFSIRKPDCAGAPFKNAGSHDLLGAPPADAEKKLDGGPVDRRKRVLTQLSNDVRQVTIPDGFGGHGVSLCYCAPAQFTNLEKAR